MINKAITLGILEKLKAEGFTMLIATAQDENKNLVYLPSKEPSELMDDASLIALSENEVLRIDEVIQNYQEYRDKGLEIEVDNDEGI